jgi:hypothetical protein
MIACRGATASRVRWFNKLFSMLIRPASLRDLPAIIALVTHEDEVIDPATIRPDDDYVKAFLAVVTRSSVLATVDVEWFSS